MKRTPLHPCHQELGARMVPFVGWEMPIQYSGIRDEALAVRHSAGLFDVSHMGRLRIRGKDRVRFCQLLVTADVEAMKLWRVRYALALRPDGTVVDDLLVAREKGILHLCVNGCNHEKVRGWMEDHLGSLDVSIEDVTDATAMMALQGPRAAEVLGPLTDIDLAAVRSYRFRRGHLLGHETLISRTGYTGEDGFEITVEASAAAEVWRALLRSPAVRPAGLGSRDTLRLEAALPLFGHEISDTITPVEAGLLRHIDLHAPFIGRETIERLARDGTSKRLVGLVSEGRRVPRQGYSIQADGVTIGEIVSGTASPTLEKNIATGYIRTDHPLGSSSLAVDIRGHLETVREVELPFYRCEGGALELP
ncbi:MAG: glycine cleavage system aminomethyltransferase GcvT [Planctomycetota bacterium]